LTPLGPIAVNTMAPDEGNMFLQGKGAPPAQKERFLAPLVRGDVRSAFFMTESGEEGGRVGPVDAAQPPRFAMAMTGCSTAARNSLPAPKAPACATWEHG